MVNSFTISNAENTRTADIIQDGSIDRLAVAATFAEKVADVTQFASSSVSAGGTATLLTYNVTSDFRLTDISLSGAKGLFEIQFNTVQKFLLRTTGSNPNVLKRFNNIEFSNGDSIIIKVTNDYHRMKQFDVTLEGYTV